MRILINDLEKWIMDRYNENMMRKQMLRAPEHSRNNLLEREKPQMPEQKLTFKITYYPAFQNIRSITPNKERKKIIPNAPLIGFRNGKNLKDYLVRTTLPILIKKWKM